jgi:GntR family transcriptional regulator
LYALSNTGTIQVVRYLDLADTLRARLAVGNHAPGGGLPSEAQLGREYAASRVTVRRALEVLRSEGLVTSRQGAGWFVALDPVRQPLGRITTIEAALEAAGAVAQRDVVEFRFEPAPAAVAADLAVATGTDVLRVKRVVRADGEPFAVVTVWVPGALGADLSRADVERASFYDLLPLRGIALGRATQTIDADALDATDAHLLGVAAGTPVLVCRRTTFTTDGRPALSSEHRYPSGRTHLEIEFPSVAFSEVRELGARAGRGSNHRPNRGPSGPSPKATRAGIASVAAGGSDGSSA